MDNTEHVININIGVSWWYYLQNKLGLFINFKIIITTNNSILKNSLKRISKSKMIGQVSS